MMRSALDFSLRLARRALHGFSIDYRRLTAWPRESPESWLGDAATRRFTTGTDAAFLESAAIRNGAMPPQVQQNLEALGRTGESFARVLDFGAGDAAYRRFISDYPPTAQWEYLGADINARVVEACRKRIPEARFEVVTDPGRVPFEDRACDVILASGVLQCVENPENLLEEFARVSRRWTVISRVPVRRYAPSALYVQRVWHRWGRELHPIHVFNRQALEDLCVRADFEITWRDAGFGWFHVPDDVEPVLDTILLLKKRER